MTSVMSGFGVSRRGFLGLTGAVAAGAALAACAGAGGGSANSGGGDAKTINFWSRIRGRRRMPRPNWSDASWRRTRISR